MGFSGDKRKGRVRRVSGSGFVELHVPIEVVAPAVRSILEAYRNPNGGRPFRPLRHADQMHAGFGRRTPAFPAIAADATCDNIFPILSAALGDRHDMIEGQLRGGEHLAAVLTRMVVPGVDVGARKWDVIDVALNLDVAQQANDRWQLETEGHGPHFAVVHRDDLDLPLAPERHRFLPVDDLQRLVRGVQQERLLHKPEVIVPEVSISVKPFRRITGLFPTL